MKRPGKVLKKVNNKLRIILIGNYPPDCQESMIRFANMLQNGFSKAGVEAIIWTPVVFFGSFHTTTISGIGKWLGYLDKWLLFPVVLRFRVGSKKVRNSSTCFHICDHSNSPYLKSLPLNRTAVTCHDVLAIRGALGHKDAYCEATRMGKVLQQWILKNLCKAEKIACVSELTLRQLQEISIRAHDKRDWRVIHNAFNAAFEPMGVEQAWYVLQKAGMQTKERYILHVGSSLPRKNRGLLLEMVAKLGNFYNGKVCFAGEVVDGALVNQAERLGLKERVTSIVKPDHTTLIALYSACDAFVFPSLSEGFGWPVIEAQACAAPVIASDLDPMPEVSGGAAIHRDPKSAQEFAGAFLSLQDEKNREEIVKNGLSNAKRFSEAEMIKKYLDLHRVSLQK